MSERTPIVDRGPWIAQKWSVNRVVLQSDDFEHDVALIVSGDFGDDARCMAYAEGLAAQINAGTVKISESGSSEGSRRDGRAHEAATAQKPDSTNTKGVQCVNSHDALVSALTNLLKRCERELSDPEDVPEIDSARAALSLAGQQGQKT